MPLEGLPQLLANLTATERATVRGAARGAYMWAEGTMTESKSEAPVATGFMRSTGYVTPPAISQQNVSIEMGYAAPYSIFVHERLNVHHPHGKAKFLESPALRRSVKLADDVAREIEREFSAAIK